MRSVAAASFFLLSCLTAPRAHAQAAPDRGWIDVNAGTATAADDAFTMSATTSLFSEPADFRARYTVPRGFSIEFTQARIDGSAWGFHAGADVSVFFLRNLGVGGFAKFGRATVELENTLATAVGDSEVVDVRAGGFQAGAGVRIGL